MEAPKESEAPRTSSASRDDILTPHDSEQTPTLSIVLPTLNEEEGIATCIQKAKRALAELGVDGEIIVSDSSSDRTPQIARALGAVVVEPDSPGYGYAYRYGFRFARGEYVAIGDADTTYDFEEFPKLFELVEDGADMAIGSRFEGEIKPGAMPRLHRYVGNPLLTRFLNVFYGADVSDAHSGMRVIRRDALDRLDLDSDGMEFASEMIMAASAAGLDIREAPITYHRRAGEATLDSFRDGWRHVRFMLVNAPGYLFTVPGLLLVLLGVSVLGLAVTGITELLIELGVRSVIVGCLLGVVGTQVVYLGVFASIAGDPIRDPATTWNEWIRRNVSLEHGTVAGLSLCFVGTAYAAVSVSQWIGSGFTDLPYLIGDIVAFTAIVIGVQTVFQSFFLSIIGSQSNG